MGNAGLVPRPCTSIHTAAFAAMMAAVTNGKRSVTFSSRSGNIFGTVASQPIAVLGDVVGARRGI